MPCKVDRVAAKYGLDDLDSELLDAREGGDSLRELETRANRAVLRRALRDAGADPLPGEVANIHRLLTDEDVSEGTALRLREKLDRLDIDHAELAEDFVSYQTVRTHLRDCLNVDTSRQQSVSLEDERETLFGLLGRTERVVEGSLSRLRAAGLLELGGIEVTATVRVVCPECNRSYTLSTLFAERGCACTDEES